MSVEAVVQVANHYGLMESDPAQRVENLHQLSANELRTALGAINTAITGNNPPEVAANAYIVGAVEGGKVNHSMFGTPNEQRRTPLYIALKDTVDTIITSEAIDTTESKLSYAACAIGTAVVAIHSYYDASGRTARAIRPIIQEADPVDLGFSLMPGNRMGDLDVYSPYAMDPFMNAYTKRHTQAEQVDAISSHFDEQFGIAKSMGIVVRSNEAIMGALTGVEKDSFKEHLGNILQSYRVSDIATATALGERGTDLASWGYDEAWSVIAADAALKDAYALSAITADIAVEPAKWFANHDMNRLRLG